MATKGKKKVDTNKSARARKGIHKFFTERNIEEGWVVMRIDDCPVQPANRGQFAFPEVPALYAGSATPATYPLPEKRHIRVGAIWPTVEGAIGAAKWAVSRFPGRVYGICQMRYIVQPTDTTATMKVA